MSFRKLSWVKVLFFATVISGFLSCNRTPSETCSNCDASGGRDFYLVVDVSGSMADANRTIEKVKKSIPTLMSVVAVGDTVKLMSFAEKPKVIETVKINSESDKESITRAVDKLEAKGLYTDMAVLIDFLREKLGENTASDRKQFLVILTDGEDDPSPANRKRRIALAKYRDTTVAENFPSENFIYYINLGNIKDPALEKGLGSVSKNVKVIEGGAGRAETKTPSDAGTPVADTSKSGDSSGKAGSGVAKAVAAGAGVAAVVGGAKALSDGKAGSGADKKSELSSNKDADKKEEEVKPESNVAAALSEVATDIEKKSNTDTGRWAWVKNWFEKGKEFYKKYSSEILLALLVLLGLLLLYLIFWLLKKFNSRHKLQGRFDFFETDIRGAFKNSYQLNKLQKSDMTLGSKPGVDMKVKNLGIHQILHFKCDKVGGAYRLKPVGKSSSLIKFIDQDKKRYISAGDKFIIGNFTFEYKYGKD